MLLQVIIAGTEQLNPRTKWAAVFFTIPEFFKREIKKVAAAIGGMNDSTPATPGRIPSENSFIKKVFTVMEDAPLKLDKHSTIGVY